MSLSTLIKTIQDIMRKDVGVDGDAQRISQMVWLLFLKIYDDKEKEWEFTNKNYKSPLPNRFKWSTWAANDEGDTGEELIDFVNNELFPALKKLSITAGVSPHGKVIGSVFEDAYNYMKSGTLLRQVINTIQSDVDFNSSPDRHLFNDIYEKILRDLQSAGNAGEYYTPRAVTEFMVDILDPQLGEKVFDPACGTGGFLVNVIEYKKKQFKTSDDIVKLQENILGIEKKPLPHMLAMTNMMLHGIDVPSNIKHDNTLSRPLKDYGPKDRVDVIITNPPFGGVEEDGIEKNFPRQYQTRETADLFMALIMHLLKTDSGRAAVVLPDGFLAGEGVKTTLKKELLENFNLHTIVRLPNNVFSPYTGIKTNILFFEKGGSTKDVWFFEHPYPNGTKSYSKSKPLKIEEFDLEKRWWNKRTSSEFAWKVSRTEIEDRNYNLDIKNPYFVDIIHKDPEVLMHEYKKLIDDGWFFKNLIKKELQQTPYHQVLLKYFDTLYTTHESIGKLKKIVLQLCVKGSFSTQNPKDLPASKSILSNITFINCENPTFDEHPVLGGWVTVELGSVIELKYGKGVPKELITTEGFPVYGANGAIKFSTKPMVHERCIIVGRKGTAGALTIANDPCWPSDVTYFVVPQPNIRFTFLYYLLLSLDLPDFAKGIKPGINRNEIYKMSIDLPPLDEQDRIVKKLEDLFKLCDGFANNLIEGEKKRTEILNATLSKVKI